MKELRVIYTGPNPCHDCEGWKELDFEGVSRKAWAELPPPSRIAYDMGVVDFHPCKRCGGTGKEPEDE